MVYQNPNAYRESREEGEQPYTDAKEALSQKEAEIARDAVSPEEPGQGDTGAVRTAQQEAEAEARFAQIADEVTDTSDRNTTKGDR